MSDEARALYNAGKDGPRSPHGLVYRSPVINISRDPRWGRIQEVFSEDPYLTGRMAVAYVRGLQGEGHRPPEGRRRRVKHFAVNNVEAGRQHLSAVVDERNLFDYWFPHWKAAFVEGKAQSVMSSYNAINGVPSAVNRWLLTDVLRRQWGFDGFVTDDLGAVQLLTSERPNEPGHRFSDDPVVSTAAAIKAGNDSDDQEFEDNIPKAVQRGLLTVADVDKALSNVLRVGFRLGAFDPSTPYDTIPMSVVRNPDHLALSLQVAQKSLTLLSNRSSGAGTTRTGSRPVAVPAAEAGGDAVRSPSSARPATRTTRPATTTARRPARSASCRACARCSAPGVTVELREGRGLRRARRCRRRGPRGGAGQAVGRRGPLPRHRPAGRGRRPRPPRPEPARRAAAAARSRVRAPTRRSRSCSSTPARSAVALGARSAAGDPRGVVPGRGRRHRRRARAVRHRQPGRQAALHRLRQPRRGAAAERVRRLEGLHLPVLQGRAALSVRARPQLHALPLHEPEALGGEHHRRRARSRSPSTSPTSATAPATRWRSSTRAR